MANTSKLSFLHRGKLTLDDVVPEESWLVNGTPVHVSDDAVMDRCVSLSGGASFYLNSLSRFDTDAGFIAANYQTSSSAKQTIIAATHTTAATPSVLSLWIDGGKLYGKLTRNGLAIWQLASTVSTLADGAWRRVALSGGADGPKLWINGVAIAVNYEVGSSANPEWFSNVLASSVTFKCNRLSLGVSRISGANIEPFVGKLRNVTFDGAAATVASMQADYLANQQAYDLIILWWQSNMIGRYGPISATLDKTDVRIRQWGRNDPNANAIMLAADPLEHISAGPDTVGPGMSIAKEWVRRRLAPGRRVLLIPVAEGNTGFRADDWNVSSSNNYSGMLQRVSLAMASCSGNRIVGMCAQGGEADAAGNTAERDAVTSEVREMMSAFRGAFPSESFPATFGTMPQAWVDTVPGYAIVQQQLLAMQETIPQAIVVDNTDLPSQVSSGTEVIHYSADSNRKSGTRHGAALADYWENPSDYLTRSATSKAAIRRAVEGKWEDEEGNVFTLKIKDPS